MELRNKSSLTILVVVAVMAVFFLLAHPVMMDDGYQYESFTEKLANGVIDFKSFYGFQGLSFFAVPIYWLTHSHLSIIIASALFSLMSIPLAFAIGKRVSDALLGGYLGVVLFLLTPYPYVTMMRGFQEAALLFFILLIMYGALEKKPWTGLAWGIGAIVKPFSLVLAPLFIRKDMKKIEIWFLTLGICVGIAYGIANYVQTGHFVTLAATGAYHGAFDANNIPELGKSFALDWKTWARVPANLFIATRKIMVSPFVIVLGIISLWKFKTIPLRKRIIVAIALNILLVGAITYAFPKYLLPMTTLLTFLAIPMIVRYPVLIWLVFLDSLAVFIPIYTYFGHNFWDPVVFWIPFILAICIYVYAHYNPHASRA